MKLFFQVDFNENSDLMNLADVTQKSSVYNRVHADSQSLWRRFFYSSPFQLCHMHGIGNDMTSSLARTRPPPRQLVVRTARTTRSEGQWQAPENPNFMKIGGASCNENVGLHWGHDRYKGKLEAYISRHFFYFFLLHQVDLNNIQKW